MDKLKRLFAEWIYENLFDYMPKKNIESKECDLKEFSIDEYRLLYKIVKNHTASIVYNHNAIQKRTLLLDKIRYNFEVTQSKIERNGLKH